MSIQRPKTFVSCRVNYGMQAFYRAHGIEPHCGICRWFDGEVIDLDRNSRLCLARGRVVTPADICFSPERAAGADEPGPVKGPVDY